MATSRSARIATAVYFVAFIALNQAFVSGSPTEINTQSCEAVPDSANSSDALLFRASSTCALSSGCQRAFCTCLGVGFDATTARCQPTRPAPAANTSALTCNAIEACHRDAISCHQQAAVLTAQTPSCQPVSQTLYDTMILAAVGSPARLTHACANHMCWHYNNTAAYLGMAGASAFAQCVINASSTANCPIPQPAPLHMYIDGESWSEVLTSERYPLLSASMRQDIALAVGSGVHVALLSLQNTSRLHARLTVSVDIALAYVKATLATRDDSWLASTAAAYASFGGRGQLTVAAMLDQPFEQALTSITPPPTPSTDVPGGNDTAAPTVDVDDVTLPPALAGASSRTVGDDSSGCAVDCQLGIVAAVVAVAIVGCAVIAIYRSSRQQAEASHAVSGDADVIPTKEAAPRPTSADVPIVTGHHPRHSSEDSVTTAPSAVGISSETPRGNASPGGNNTASATPTRPPQPPAGTMSPYNEGSAMAQPSQTRPSSVGDDGVSSASGRPPVAAIPSGRPPSGQSANGGVASRRSSGYRPASAKSDNGSSGTTPDRRYVVLSPPALPPRDVL